MTEGAVAAGVGQRPVRDHGAVRPRVVVFHPSDEAYGADRVVLEVVDALRDDHDLQVYLPRDVVYEERPLSANLRERGVGVRSVDVPVLRRSYLSPRGLPSLLRRALVAMPLLWRHRGAACYLNTSAMLLIAPLARLVGCTVLLHSHETWTRRERTLLTALVRCCHEIIAVSEAVKDGLPASVRERTTVIHNGFAVPATSPAARSDLRTSIRAAEHDVVALIASRWNGGKGHEMLLEAWSRLDRDDVHLVVLGGPPVIGTSFDVCAAVASRTGLARVHVIGETREIGNWMTAADVVLVPSTAPDSLPTVAIEAMSLGRPVFAADIGGLPEIVASGETGLLLPPGDVDAWYERLRTMQRSDLEGLGAQGLRRFAAAFSAARFVEEFRGYVTHRLDPAWRRSG